jgi:hypothetical protein
MTRFFLPYVRKVCLGLCSLAFLAISFAAVAQTTVTVIGPVTPGDIPQFNSTTIIKDSGLPVSALPTGLANPTGAVGLSAVNGSATTAMRSDAAPPLSATVQSALTATVNQFLVGTGAFGFSSLTQQAALNAIMCTPTRAGDLVFWNGTNWVCFAGNNSGTQILSENASGVLAWSPGAGVASFNGLTGAVTTSIVVQTFTTTGTYTPTSGMLHAIIECVGGGGGGGGISSGAGGSSFGAAGGGSGSYSRLLASAATIGVGQTVTIGTAGSGATAGASNGGAGGDTSVGTLCTGKGGAGGGFSSGSQVGTSGAGGVAGTGGITAAGQPGQMGPWIATNISVAGGAGGSSIFGGGAIGVGNSNGAAASNYGSGGSGGAVQNAIASRSGGAGSAGIVIITEFVNL